MTIFYSRRKKSNYESRTLHDACTFMYFFLSGAHVCIFLSGAHVCVMQIELRASEEQIVGV